MDKKQYQFRLREDMPEGFIENERYPIYPAMTNFLKKFSGKYFSTPKSIPLLNPSNVVKPGNSSRPSARKLDCREIMVLIACARPGGIMPV